MARKGGSGEKRTEIELKLALERPALEALRLMASAGDWTLGAPRRSRLRSVYYDTQDQRLRRAGFALRVRQDRRGFLQTIKSKAGVAQGLSTPVEVEGRIDGPAPDLARVADAGTRDRLVSLLAGASLEALFETDVMRTTRRITRGDTELELALDEGEIKSGPRRALLIEAELELKSGAPQDMASAARALFEAHPFRFSSMSKAARGYALLAGEEAQPPGAATALSLSDPGLSCRAALTAILRDAFGQIEAARAVALDTQAPEGAHQIRVGLRRLRTALRVFRPAIGPSGEKLATLAGDLARIVGRQRDADVLLDEICAPLAGEVSEADGFAALRETLERHRSAMRAETRQALEGPAWRGFALELALWPAALPEDPALDEPLRNFAPKALKKVWTKVARRARDMKTMTIEERHELRKALKKLRYAIEFFAPLFPSGEVAPFVKRLKRLQDDFGYLNDAANAAHVVALVRADDSAGAPAHEAAGFVLGWHAARAEDCWRDARRRWTRLKAQERFWA